MATSFRRKKHQDERASEASDFLCTRFQMCTKNLETVSTLRNHFMFLQMVVKKDTYSLSETEANWTRNCLFFSNQFPVQEFSSIFHNQSRLQDQAITMNQGKMCCLGIPTTIKFETNFELLEICLDGHHLSSFNRIHHPFWIIYQVTGI